MRARDVALGLLGVAALGAAVRLLPLLSFAVWGSDTGEYHRLTEMALRDGRLDLGYAGWGIAYAWFPGLYAITAGLAAMTGLSPRITLEVVVPALAGLAAVGVALLAHRVFRQPLPALLAGASVAVLMPHALATSHAMPGALGHLLLLGALLLAWDLERDRLAGVALAVVLLALVATHHLSTYMLLLALGGALLLRALLVAKPEPARHLALWATMACTLALALAWWTWARPIREQVVPTQSDVGLAGFAALAIVGAGVAWLLPALRARLAWRHRPLLPPAEHGLKRVAVMFAVLFVGLTVVGFVGIPGTSVQITPAALPYILPIALLIAFGFLGSQRIKLRPRGVLVYGWALAVLGSLAVMAAANSVVLLPYRHAEYLMEPVAILAGAGLAAGLGLAAKRGLARPAALGVAALLLANVAIAYPPPSVLAGFQEGTTREEFAAVMWARERLVLAPDAVIASDHRLSSMLFGYAGLDATWEYAPRLFHAATFAEAEGEVRAVKSPSGEKRVDYALLSDTMREGVALLQWEPARPMSAEAQAKFGQPPFQVLCRSPTVEVYRIQWPDAPQAAAPTGPPPACAP